MTKRQNYLNITDKLEEKNLISPGLASSLRIYISRRKGKHLQLQIDDNLGKNVYMGAKLLMIPSDHNNYKFYLEDREITKVEDLS